LRLRLRLLLISRLRSRCKIGLLRLISARVSRHHAIAGFAQPQKAEDFKLELPADLKMPEGVTFQFNPNDPAIEPARQFALRNNLSQQQFSEMVGVYVAAQANEMVAFNTAKAAEVAKLGDAANARVDAVTGWLKAMGGNHFGALAKVLQLAPVAETVVALEHLMHRYVSQGGGSFSGAHREPSLPGRVSDETYNSMTYSQKLDMPPASRSSPAADNSPGG
jgi:hypothetical protein